MRISVIMPVFLGEYPTRGVNPDYKFKRAVTSFLLQEFKDAELIIISDGCDIAKSIYEKLFSACPRVRFRQIEKQPSFGGRTRQEGIEMAQG
jgi:glycosyltransferase involved in cell wall biosynthesis